MIVKLPEPVQSPAGVLQAVQLVTFANRPFHDAMTERRPIGLNVSVLLRRGGLGELLSDLFVAEVLLNRLGHEPRGGPLAAVVIANIKPLGQSVAFKNRVK